MNYSKQTKAQLIDYIASITEEKEALTARYVIVLAAGFLLGYALAVY